MPTQKCPILTLCKIANDIVFTNDVQKVKALEQKERAMYEKLLLISELKRIYIARHLKR